jgi:hypothetical protein
MAGTERSSGGQPALLQSQVQAKIPEQAAAGQLLAQLTGLQQLGCQGLPVLLDQGSQQGLEAVVLALQQRLLLTPDAGPGAGRRHHNGASGRNSHGHGGHGPDPLYNGIVMLRHLLPFQTAS